MFSRQMDVDADADVGEGLGSLQNMIYNILDGERAPFKNFIDLQHLGGSGLGLVIPNWNRGNQAFKPYLGFLGLGYRPVPAWGVGALEALRWGT